MEVSANITAAASIAQLYASSTQAAAKVDPLDTADKTQKNVAIEVSMYALKQTLNMAGQIVDLLV